MGERGRTLSRGRAKTVAKCGSPVEPASTDHPIVRFARLPVPLGSHRRNPAQMFCDAATDAGKNGGGTLAHLDSASCDADAAGQLYALASPAQPGHVTPRAQAKSELTESELWMRLIASARRRAMLATSIFGHAFAASESGTVSVTTTLLSGDSAMR